MLTLQKITTEYVELEDRIRLAGEMGNQEAVVVWLTQRLLQRLVPVLLQYLGGQAPAEQSFDVLQSFAQQAALAELQQQPPVQTATDGVTCLALKVEIRKTSEMMRLEFIGEQGQPILLELGATTLRQWLAILHDAYIRAEWPLDVWPEWMERQGKPANILETLQ